MFYQFNLKDKGKFVFSVNCIYKVHAGFLVFRIANCERYKILTNQKDEVSKNIKEIKIPNTRNTTPTISRSSSRSSDADRLQHCFNLCSWSRQSKITWLGLYSLTSYCVEMKEYGWLGKAEKPQYQHKLPQTESMQLWLNYF